MLNMFTKNTHYVIRQLQSSGRIRCTRGETRGVCLEYDISGGRQHRNTVPELGLRPAADVYCTTPVQLYIDYCFIEVKVKAICAYITYKL